MISKTRLFAAARAIGDSQLSEKVARWYESAAKTDFDNFVELRMMFQSVDWVADMLVFNLGSYRLICGVSFERKTIYFKALLNHAKYDQGGWK